MKVKVKLNVKDNVDATDTFTSSKCPCFFAFCELKRHCFELTFAFEGLRHENIISNRKFDSERNLPLADVLPRFNFSECNVAFKSLTFEVKLLS